MLAASTAALVGGASASSLALCTTTTSTPTVTPSSAVHGTDMTFTATVTASAGCANGFPTGSVAFYSNYVVNGQPTAFQVGDPATLVPTATAGVSTATLVNNSLPSGSFAITASYTSDNEPLFYDSVSANGTNVLLSNSTVNATKIDFTLTPSTVTVGQSVSFHVTVTAVDANGNPTGTVPTGNVDFSAGPTGASGQTLFASYELDSSGSVDFTYNGLVAGDYIVDATYPGDSGDGGITGQLPLDVLPGASSIATTTTVSANPSSITTGASTTLSAHVVEAGGQTPPAGGEVDFSAGPGITNLSSEGSGQLDANGNASVSVGNFPAGSYDIRAQYVGNSASNIAGSYGDNSLLVTASSSGGGGGATNPTSSSYAGPTSATVGAQVTLTGQLEKGDGSPLSGEPLTLALGSQSCVTGLTNGGGEASCSISLTQGAGQYPVTVTFAGDANWITSSGSATFTVNGLPTSLAYTGATTAAYGASATLSAKLTDGGGNALSGKTLQLTMGSQSCTGVTDGSGVASCPIAVTQIPALLGYPITATFAGDSTYAGSSASGTFIVTATATTTAYTGDTQASVGATATLKAHLVDSAGHPVSGETITIVAGTQSCTATTDASGNATCSITVNQLVGSYPVTATFIGDTSYTGSAGTATFTVVAAGSKATTILLAPVAPVLKGSTVTLGAALISGFLPVKGETLTLTLGTHSCTATTNLLGIATCSVTAGDPAGEVQVKAAFAGDTTYKASSATGTAIIYTFAPGGGAFVVGDRSDSGSVTFWGSQWSKSNSLSGGSAPSSFKGFAVSPTTPQCGGTWSTDPGNSSPPPAGPLPAYMAVVVTSSTSKSGSKISGNIVAIVLVKTNAGYQADPGHAGTGTVVATLCQAGSGSKDGNGGGGDDDDHHGGNDQGGGGRPSFGF